MMAVMMAMTAAPAVNPRHKAIVPVSTMAMPPRAAMMVAPSPVTVVPPMTAMPMSDLLDIGPDSLRQNDPGAAGRDQRRCSCCPAERSKRGGEDDCETLLPHGTSSYGVGRHFLWS